MLRFAAHGSKPRSPRSKTPSPSASGASSCSRRRCLKAERYGASREQLGAAPAQRGLFNEVEVLAELGEVSGVEPPLSATPLREVKPASTAKPGRRALASHLPRREVRHELPLAERSCACGGELREIGAEVSEQLDYVPARIEVVRHVRVKYACPGCESCVKTAGVPAQMLPKSNAAPGLLAQIVTAKYVDALPLHRQEAMFARHGVALPRATQAAWLIGLTSPLQPLMNLLDERLRESGYIRMDETPVQVLNSDKARGAEHWMWVRVAGPPRQRIILFDYDPSRSGATAERLLAGAQGFLQTDGYAAYDGVAARLALTHVGCFAHARRRGFEALKALPSGVAANTPAHELVRRIDALYAIEREVKSLDPEERTRVRIERARPLLDSLHAWARDQAAVTLPSGKLGEAFAYLIAQWPNLVRYLDDPRLAIDTNLAENAIRPFALGRRNWLFSDTVNGATASATLYSLVSTARANELEPHAYLRHLFERLPQARTVEDFESLLPFTLSDSS
jgi:transposase